VHESHHIHSYPEHLVLREYDLADIVQARSGPQSENPLVDKSAVVPDDNLGVSLDSIAVAGGV
jgi:hypothetical protein